MGARWMIVGAWLVAGVAVASADPSTAERSIDRAEALAARGDLAGAAASYRDAFREDPRPSLPCSIGVAYYNAKDRPRAHRYLDQCVAEQAALDPALVGTTSTLLATLEPELAAGPYKPLDLFVEPPLATTAFDKLHDEPLVGSRRVWLPFGTYRLTIQAPGYADQVIEIHASDARPAVYAVRLVPVPSAAAPEPRAVAALSAGRSRAPRSRSLLAPVIVGTGACVLGALALGVYVSALHTAERAGDLDVTRSQYETLSVQARTQQRLSWALGAAAGVTGVVGAVLWYRASRSPTRIDVGASSRGGSVSLLHRW